MKERLLCGIPDEIAVALCKVSKSIETDFFLAIPIFSTGGNPEGLFLTSIRRYRERCTRCGLIFGVY
jgi:hypothetical protein